MNPDVKEIVDSVREEMDGSIKHLEQELLKIRAGKANPIMLHSVKVEAYGSVMPINQVASVTTVDARTIGVSPFDKSTLHNIERGIIAANLGLNPQNDGTRILVPIPQLTEERRKALVKQAKAEGESAKVSIRNHRKEGNDLLKDMKEDGYSEDAIKRGEDAVQDVTNEYSKKVDDIIKIKEDEIMTI